MSEDRRSKLKELFGKIEPTAPAARRMEAAGETPPTVEPKKEEEGDMSQADFSGYTKKPAGDPAKLAKILRNR